MDTTTQYKSDANTIQQAATKHAQAPHMHPRQQPQTTTTPSTEARQSWNPACRQPTTQEMPQNVNHKAHGATMATKQHIDHLSSYHLVAMITTRAHRQTPLHSPSQGPPAHRTQTPQTQMNKATIVHNCHHGNMQWGPQTPHSHPAGNICSQGTPYYASAPPHPLTWQTLRPQPPIKI